MTAADRRWCDPLLLFRIDTRWLDALLTAVVASVLAVTRFALLARGPWEWDETLFARGILHFELAAHFPHPPGFPGWLAIGHLLLPFAGEPLRALQWGSAALSVASLWPLAALGRRVATPPVAVAAAALILATPGPWLYSVRGFSSTPAGTLALAAAAVAITGLEGRRATLFTVLVAAAFLIRPILLPGLAVLWLAGAAIVRPRRRLLAGVAIAIGMVLLAVAAMARAEGGWAALARPFLAHTEKHFSRLAQDVGGWEDLGLVKGLGSGAIALALLAVAALGLVIWSRRVGRRSALAWLLVIAVTALQLVALQNRSYARYAVPIHLAMAPLIASAAATLPPALATGALIAATGWVASSSYPLVAEQHRNELPGWRAVDVASQLAIERRMAVVVEPELYPFASYRWHLLEREGREAPPLVLSPWAPEPWVGVEDPYLVATVHRDHYGASIAGGELGWDGVSPALEPYTQQRFLEAWVIDAPALPVGQWWPVEVAPDGARFQWGGARCDLMLPPLPAGTRVAAEVHPAPGPAPLAVLFNGEPAPTERGNDHVLVEIAPEEVDPGGPNLLSFRREEGYPPGPADPRPLALQLLGVDVWGPKLPWQVRVSSAEDLHRHDVWLDGGYPPEPFGTAGHGVWLAPTAQLVVRAVAGRLSLTLLAPRPTAPRTLIRIAGQKVAGPIDPGPEPAPVWIPIVGDAAGKGVVSIELTSTGYRPSDHGAADDRELGVALTMLRFEPAAAPGWTRPLEPTIGRDPDDGL